MRAAHPSAGRKLSRSSGPRCALNGASSLRALRPVFSAGFPSCPPWPGQGGQSPFGAFQGGQEGGQGGQILEIWPLFFPFLPLSSLPAPPTPLPRPLRASGALRAPPRLLFLLFRLDPPAPSAQMPCSVFFYCFFLLFLADLGKKIERCAVGKIGPKGRFSCQFRQENTAWSKSCPKGRIFLLFLAFSWSDSSRMTGFSCFFLLFHAFLALRFLAFSCYSCGRQN